MCDNVYLLLKIKCRRFPVQTQGEINIKQAYMNTIVNDFVTQKCIMFQHKGIQDCTVHSFSDDIWCSSCCKVSETTF